MALIVMGLVAMVILAVVEACEGFPITRRLAFRLANTFTKYERYKVVNTKSTGHFHHTFCSLTLEESGMLIPVECDVDVYSRIRDLLDLNGRDREVFVKAKIDSKRLKLVSVKGYNVK